MYLVGPVLLAEIRNYSTHLTQAGSQCSVDVGSITVVDLVCKGNSIYDVSKEKTALTIKPKHD